MIPEAYNINSWLPCLGFGFLPNGGMILFHCLMSECVFIIVMVLVPLLINKEIS